MNKKNMRLILKGDEKFTRGQWFMEWRWVGEDKAAKVFELYSPDRWLGSFMGYGSRGFVGAVEAEANAHAAIAAPIALEVCGRIAKDAMPKDWHELTTVERMAFEALAVSQGLDFKTLLAEPEPVEEVEAK